VRRTNIRFFRECWCYMLSLRVRVATHMLHIRSKRVTDCFRYSLKIWWEHSIGTLSFDWGWYAMVLYIDILCYCAIWCITLLMKLGLWSVIYAFKTEYELINFSTSISAISDEIVVCWVAPLLNIRKQILYREYYVQCMFVFGCQERSHDIHWYLIKCDTRRIHENYCRVFTRFFNWQFRHYYIYFCIFNFIPDQK